MQTNRECRTERMIAEWEADAIKRKADRAARYAANPEAYAERRRLALLPVGVPAAYEPDHVDLAEMHTAHMVNMQAITDFCRAYRLARENPEALKAALNHGFLSTGMPLKVITWKQWGHQ
jgi:hypothetical protein